MAQRPRRPRQVIRYEDAINELREMFPHFEDEVLQATLEANSEWFHLVRLAVANCANVWLHMLHAFSSAQYSIIA